MGHPGAENFLGLSLPAQRGNLARLSFRIYCGIQTKYETCPPKADTGHERQATKLAMRKSLAK